jgi:hypothetical protein
VRRTFTRPRALAAVAICGLVAAGCGGSGGGGGSAAGAAGTDGLGAKAAPASSIAFFDVNIDRGSDSWKQLVALGSRFPGWAKLQAQIDKSLAETSSDGTNFKTDIEPWLGGEASVAVTGVQVGGSGSNDTQYVVFVQSTDDAKAEAALVKGGEATKGPQYNGYDTYTQKGDDETYAAVGDGAVLVSNSQTTLDQAIDLRKGKGDALADSDAYKDALSKLPSDNMGVGFVNGAQLQTLAQLATAQASKSGVQAGGVTPSQLNGLTTELKGVDAISMALTPEDAGFRFRTAIVTNKDANASLTSMKTFSPSLLENAAADSYLVADYSDLGQSIEKGLQSAGSQQQITQAFGQVQAATGISVENDLVPLLSGEDAIIVGPGLPVTASLLLHPADAAAGEATMRKITAALTKMENVPFTNANGGQTTQVQGLSVGWRRAGDLLAVSNDPKAGDKPTSPLGDDSGFKSFEKAVGVPDKVNGLFYLDVGRLLGLAKGFMGNASASDQEAIDNLAHVGRVIVYGSQDGSTLTSDTFVEITK